MAHFLIRLRLIFKICPVRPKHCSVENELFRIAEERLSWVLYPVHFAAWSFLARQVGTEPSASQCEHGHGHLNSFKWLFPHMPIAGQHSAEYTRRTLLPAPSWFHCRTPWPGNSLSWPSYKIKTISLGSLSFFAWERNEKYAYDALSPMPGNAASTQ